MRKIDTHIANKYSNTRKLNSQKGKNKLEYSLTFAAKKDKKSP